MNMRRSVIAAAIAVMAGLVQAQEPVIKGGETLAFLGDSITQQGAQNAFGYVNLVLKGLELNGIKVTSVKAGISGHKSNDMLARLDKDVLSKKPNIMTLSCGVNDVWHGAKGIPLEQYKTNITAIVDRCQSNNVKVVILTSTLIKEPGNDFNKKLDDYNDFLRAFSKERNLPLADLNADMKKLFEANPRQNRLTVDGVHMAPRGNVMMAKGILLALGLTQDQVKKAEECWLDMPNTCDYPRKISFRELEKIIETADAAKAEEKK